MDTQILYLDARRIRAVGRALGKHGVVSYVPDINQALFSMAEKDFDYFFIDADTPQARAFLKHLKHDPQLPPPKALVLLTDNEEEDCEAWGVDTFVKRSRVIEDVPYIFSHLKGEPFEHANVLRIAPPNASESSVAGNKTASRKETFQRLHRKREERQSRRGSAGKSGAQDPLGERDSDDEHERATYGLESALRTRATSRSQSSVASGGRANTRYRYAAVFLLVVALGLWLFTWGPFATGKARIKNQVKKKVEAESGSKSGKNSSSRFALPLGYSSSPGLTSESAPSAVPTTKEVPVSVESPVRSEPPPTNVAEQAPQPINHPPSVSISGPTHVHVGETVTYYANASDPDADSLSYSWGGSSKNKCWQTPGQYSISVTVLDSGGLSASDSLLVEVMQ